MTDKTSELARATVRGSRRHVLDWVEVPNFRRELIRLAAPVTCGCSDESAYLPLGYESPTEARLERFGPTLTSLPNVWGDLAAWWLVHGEGANTPNWDIAINCDVEGKSGLLLVEAKANVPELGKAGKRLKKDATAKSQKNHNRIREAIAEANDALRGTFPDLRISIDAHYQLANRLAFGWKLASLGIPTIVMYLGFTGDAGIADAGEPFRDDAHWRDVFRAHLSAVAPAAIAETRIDCGAAPFWLLVRSRQVLTQSPPRARRE